MAKIRFRDINFQDETIDIIAKMNSILSEYKGRVSVRQLFYRFVTKNWIVNTQKSYDRIQSIATKARYAGMIDWDHIEDRNRESRKPKDYGSGSEALIQLNESFRLDRWADQPFCLEVWCFPPNTPVTVPSGTSQIKDLKIKDKVIDRNGDERKILNTFKRPYTGDLIEIKACGLVPFQTTPNHRILVARADTSLPGYKGAKRKHLAPAFVPASEIRKNDLVFVPVNKSTIDRKTFKTKGGPRTKKEPTIQIDDLTCSVIGLFVAEGSIRPDNRTVQFTFNRTEIAFAEIVKKWSKRAGLHCQEDFGAGTRIIYIHSKAAANFFGDNFGRGSWNVCLPLWAMKLPRNKQLKIIEYYFRGDAALWDESRSALTSGSRSGELSRQMQILIARCGYSSSLHIGKDHGEPTHRVTIAGTHAVKVADLWSIPLPFKKRKFTHMNITEDYMICPVRKTRKIAYDGDVYNIEVEKTNTYCVPCVVHNCEKAALADVLVPISDTFHVTMMVQRGYGSASAMKESADRIRYNCQTRPDGSRPRPIVIYLGDHDPSGLDMGKRDIYERLTEFGCPDWLDVRMLALTMDQIEEYKCPPNPLKTKHGEISDSRAAAYQEKYGDESWELDALPPDVLEDMLADAVKSYIDKPKMDAIITRENKIKAALKKVAMTLPQ